MFACTNLIKVDKTFFWLMQKTYSHRKAAQILNISYPTLLRWINNGKIADVARDRNGYRLFTEEDINRIRTFAEETKRPPHQLFKQD